MTIQEKQAWFVLLVLLATITAYGILLYALQSPQRATAAFALLALLAATGFVGRKERASGKVTVDERDRQINAVATLVAYSVFWVVLCCVAWVPAYIYGPNAMIRTSTIALLLYPAMCLVFTVRSLVTIALYRRGNHE